MSKSERGPPWTFRPEQTVTRAWEAYAQAYKKATGFDANLSRTINEALLMHYGEASESALEQEQAQVAARLKAVRAAAESVQDPEHAQLQARLKAVHAARSAKTPAPPKSVKPR